MPSTLSYKDLYRIQYLTVTVESSLQPCVDNVVCNTVCVCVCARADEPLKKPVPLHEQTVKDEKGRYQRFHGAFTGGFSAGYFNTVGTKEGQCCCITTPVHLFTWSPALTEGSQSVCEQSGDPALSETLI